MALIKAVDSWKLAIDHGEKVVSAFLALRKGFDIIDHNTLLNKMRNNSVTGTELKWFNSYLDERYQYVSSDGKESSKRLIVMVFHKGQSWDLPCLTSMQACSKHKMTEGGGGEGALRSLS